MIESQSSMNKYLSDSEDSISKAVEFILNDKVVLLPTDTVYGLAVCPLNEKVVDQIFALKNRPRNQNLPIMVSSEEDLEDLGLEISPAAKKLLRSQYMPGALTLILGFKDVEKPIWLRSREEVAIRIPDHKWLLSVLQKTGPLLVTSANLSGNSQTPTQVEEIIAELNGTPDLIINGGDIKNIPSTIVNCRLDPPVFQREGVIPVRELEKVLDNE